MPIQNGSGHDVDYDVKEGEPPPGLIEPPIGPLYASIAFTFLGTGMLVAGCLPEAADPLLAGIGVLANVVAIGIQGFIVATARRKPASVQRHLSGCSGNNPTLKPGDIVEHPLKAWDRVTFCWTDQDGLRTLESAPVMDTGATVQLIELEVALRGPGGEDHAVLIV